MASGFPQIEHIYQNHHFDSTRWERYVPRDDDIVITTSIKSGTTWMQQIVLNLIFQDLQPRDINAFASWLDFRIAPLDAIIDQYEAQQHRRCIKTHLALGGLPYFPQVKYIMIGRDARDVFMSFWNHYSNLTAETFAALNDTPGRVGDPLLPCPHDIHELWREWIGRGWFGWESEGYPFWGNLHHAQSWWNYRHLPNILLVHYNDLLIDLSGEIRRIADFLNIEVAPEMLASIADAVSFGSMKRNAEQIVPGYENLFKGGPQTFINKGTNGRWRAVLSEDELALYAAAVARELTPDCAHWLENGRMAANT
jgi:aryl sulfotransferase